MICPKCNGESIDFKTTPNLVCKYCWSKPDLDWLEYVIGVDSKYTITKEFTELINKVYRDIMTKRI